MKARIGYLDRMANGQFRIYFIGGKDHEGNNVVLCNSWHNTHAQAQAAYNKAALRLKPRAEYSNCRKEV